MTYSYRMPLEDKDEFVRPLAISLIRKGWKVWYDELSLKVENSLRRSIDSGVIRAKHGLVVLSPSFLSKNWPAYQLDGLTTKEMISGNAVILPLWHKVTRDDIARYSLSLADKWPFQVRCLLTSSWQSLRK